MHIMKHAGKAKLDDALVESMRLLNTSGCCFRKIKRSRRYTNATADEEDSISEASVDDDDLDLEDTDDEEGGEVCPPGAMC